MHLRKYIEKLKPQRTFLIISFIYGIVFLILTPPFQAPDEINHFYRAYQVSQGKIRPLIVNNRLGGYIPKSFQKITEPFLGLRWNKNAKTDFKTIFKQFEVFLDADEKVFADFPNTAVYSPVTYLPQALIIFCLSRFNVPPILIFYLSRIFVFIIWLFCIYQAIKIIPHSKWLFTLLALLPMSLFINSSVSADVITNLISFLFISYILKIAFINKKFKLKEFIIISFIVFLLASSKIVYTPLVLMFLLIPKSKFINKHSYFFQLATVFFIAFASVLLWTLLMNDLYIPYERYNINYRDGTLIQGADIHQQMEYILSHNVYIFKVFINSLFKSFSMYYKGYIGTFGWLDTELPGTLIFSIYIIIFTVAILDKDHTIKYTITDKTIIGISLISVIFLVLLSLHLTFDPVGGDKVSAIQGRYFIPAFPLLFLLFYNNINKTKYFISALVLISSVIALSISTFVIYKRYYVTPDSESFEIFCDAENIIDNKYYKTSANEVLLENANTQSGIKSRSGKYSVMLHSGNKYGLTYRCTNRKSGDILFVEVWRYGKNGGIIISGNSGKDFYVTQSNQLETDNNGWDKLSITYMLNKNMRNREIGVYLYNNSIDTSFFDDLNIKWYLQKK